ncbi:MAG: hypothetical protein TREMPRED_003267, partial [Tremellales sp. Tagirdzhanova-0007]
HPLCGNLENQNPLGFYQNWTGNTDGFDLYRSSDIVFKDWVVESGDDCGAIKGNSTNVFIEDFTCLGGNGFAIGTLGQYAGVNDYVENVYIKDLVAQQIDPRTQPNMRGGIYFKTYVGVNIPPGPPTTGGGGGGAVTNLTVQNLNINNGSYAVHLYQTNGGNASEAVLANLSWADFDPSGTSMVQFSNMTFNNLTGYVSGLELVNFACSTDAPCPGIVFNDFNVQTINGSAGIYACNNTIGNGGQIQGLPHCEPQSPSLKF